MFKTLHQFSKYLWRTGSLQTALEGAGLKKFNGGPVRWKTVTLWPSAGQSEMMEYFYKPKLKYWVHPDLNPKVILDIGASNGVTAGFLRWWFPHARIISVEPQHNEALLKNAKSLGNMEVHFVALGDQNGTVTIKGKREVPGSCSIYMKATDDPNYSEEVPMKTIDTFLDELGIDSVDLIKIDCEGAETPILKAMKPERLAQVKWIFGELHGYRDFELLEYLAQAGFDIDGRKSLRQNCWKFHAIRPSVLPTLKSKWRVKWLQW